MSPNPTLLCLPFLLLAGCDLGGGPGPLPEARARAALALADAESPADATPDDGSPDDAGDRRPDPDCPRCRGTGVTRTGDGLAEVPCDCFAAADPDAPADAPAAPDPAADPPRVLVFTAPWCRACGPLKAALASAGGGFEVVDAAADPATAAAFGVSALPTLIRLEGGRETARAVGARDPAGLRRFRDDGS